jgi:TDG/mug DNA glycosylase family protein
MSDLVDKHGQRLPLSNDHGHRVTEDWMSRQVLTLEDLLRPELRAVCVGINPASVSVAAGHYYRGRLGQTFLWRLQAARLLADAAAGFEDDAAFAAGVGFTDIVKRPTRTAAELTKPEFDHGRKLLDRKLQQFGPKLVIFTFKNAATALLGPFTGNGFVAGLQVGGSPIFVMPGPMEPRETAQRRLGELSAFLA